MVSKDKLKEIILENRKFILHSVGRIVEREAVRFPEGVNKVKVLYGVRRSGKTFVLYNLFRNSKDESLYIDFEDERLADFGLGGFEVLMEAFLELYPYLLNKRKRVLLDEIQNIAGWEKFCRRVTEREDVDVFVAGSSSKIMPQEIHTSLRGRAWSMEITPFSFREYLRAKGVDINKSSIYGPEKILVKGHFGDYLRWGGFPEIIFARSEFDKSKILKEYLGSIFFRDLVERFKINNIPLLDTMITSVFSLFSQKFSLNSFYKQYKDKLPFSKDSLFAYYKYFLESMLIFEVRKFTESVYKRMRNPAKIYLVDPGLARREASQDLGRLLENIVFLELRKRTDKICYFEEEKECDFVVVKDGRFSAYQVCYELSEENREREIGGLILCCRQLEEKKGFILTFDQEEEINKEGIEIKIIPVWKWLVTFFRPPYKAPLEQP